jgi:hypothetical protein
MFTIGNLWSIIRSIPKIPKQNTPIYLSGLFLSSKKALEIKKQTFYQSFLVIKARKGGYNED